MSGLAFGVDFSKSSGPEDVADGIAGVGDFNVKLPGAGWKYLSKSTGEAYKTEKFNHTVATHTGYLARVVDNEFQAGLALNLPERNPQIKNWIGEPCKVDFDVIYKDMFGGSFSKPECLIVSRQDKYLVNPSARLYKDALKWFDGNGVKVPSAIYRVEYYRYSAHGFGFARIAFPIKSFESEQRLIEWSKALPDKLRGLFDRQVNIVEFPGAP